MDWVEHSEWLGHLSRLVRRPAAGLLEGRRVRSALSGSWLGHPAHPAVVSLPLGMWSAALVADLTGNPESAQRLTAVGPAGAMSNLRHVEYLWDHERIENRYFDGAPSARKAEASSQPTLPATAWLSKPPTPKTSGRPDR